MDPVTASIIFATVASTAAVTSAASATVQAEGKKDVAKAENEIKQRQADREAFSNLNSALAQEGTTSLFKEASVYDVIKAEEETKWIANYEEKKAKHEANASVEEAWVIAAASVAMAGLSAASVAADAAKLTADAAAVSTTATTVATPLVPAGTTVLTPAGGAIQTLDPSILSSFSLV